MARGGKIQIDFVATAKDRVSSTMKNVNKSVKGVGKSAGKAGAGVSALGVGLAAAGAAAAAAAVKLVSLANETAAYGDLVAKTSARLGLSVEEYQRLDHALKISGSSMEDQKGAFVRLARVADDANEGLKAASDSFDRIGVSVVDASGKLKKQPELIGDVADAFARMEDGTEKTAIAAELFGRKGTDMLQFLNLGREGISALGDEAVKLGGVMSGKATAAAEEYTDSIARLDLAWSGIKRTIGMAVMPALEAVANAMTGTIAPASNAEGAIRSYSEGVIRDMRRAAKNAEKSTRVIVNSFNAQTQAARGSMVAEAAAAAGQTKRAEIRARLQGEINFFNRKAIELEAGGFDSATARQTAAKRALQMEKELKAALVDTTAAIKASQDQLAAEIDAIERAGKVAAGVSEAQQRADEISIKIKAEAKKGATDELRDLKMDLEDAKDQIRREGARGRGGGGGARRVAVLDKTADRLRKVAEGERAAAAAMLESAKAARRLASVEDGFLRDRAGLLAELNRIRESAKVAEFKDAQAEGVRVLALAEQVALKEIELADLVAARKAGISEESLARDKAAADERKAILEKSQADTLAALQNATAGVAGDLTSMNSELGATHKAVFDGVGMWKQYAAGQSDIGAAVVGSAGAIGAATTAFVDSEKQKAGILSAVHTAQAIASGASGNIAAATAHAAAAALFFGIATGAVKMTAPGGGGGGEGGGSGPSPERGPGEEGGGGRSVTIQFGGGIVLGRPQDVANAIAQAGFSARGTGKMGVGV